MHGMSSRRVLPLSSDTPLVMDSSNSSGSDGHQPQQFCLRWNNHQTNFVGVMEQLLQSESLVDVTIAVDGGFLPAHRVVLCACSPYFEALFARATDKHPLIVLPDVSMAEAQALLSFMYRGEVSVREDRLPRLLRLADILRVRGLAEVQPSAIPQPESLLTQHLHESPVSTTPPVAHYQTSAVAPQLATSSAATSQMQQAQSPCRQQLSSPSPNSVRNRSSGTKRPLAQSSPAPSQQPNQEQQQQHPAVDNGPEPSVAAAPVTKRKRGRPRRTTGGEQTGAVTSTATATTTTTRARRARLESMTSVKPEPDVSSAAETPPLSTSPAAFTPNTTTNTEVDEELEIEQKPPPGIVYVETEETWCSGSLGRHYSHATRPQPYYLPSDEYYPSSNLQLQPDICSSQHFVQQNDAGPVFSSSSPRQQQSPAGSQIFTASIQLRPGDGDVEAQLRRQRDEEFVTRIIARVREECQAEGDGGDAVDAEFVRYRSRRTRTSTLSS